MTSTKETCILAKYHKNLGQFNCSDTFKFYSIGGLEMNQRKYRFFKILALIMAFVWLIGTYATGMTGVHATDHDFDYMGSVEDNNGVEYLREPIVGTIGVVPLSDWPPNLQRRDHPSSPPDSDPTRPYFPTSAVVTAGMSLGEIFEMFFNCPQRMGSDASIISSGHPDHAGVRFPFDPDATDEENEAARREAFRVFHAGGLPYLNMAEGSTTTFPGNRLNTGYFQYAYVQYLHFNMNFYPNGISDPGDIRERYQRMVIMGVYYDRMFVGQYPNIGVGEYFTLRNYLFPVSPNCPITPRCPVLSTVRPGTVPHSTQRDVAHPNGYIFGGWFRTPEQADNTASQDGRAWERDMGNVTTALNRSVYARWYRPEVDKVVNPGIITPQQIAAGAPVTYTITIDTDNMPAYLINFNVVDELDERLTFLPGTVNIAPTPTAGPNPSFTFVDGVLTFDISGFEGVETISEIEITFQVRVNPGATGTIENIASLYGPSGTGPSGGDGPITYSPPAELEILPDGSITIIVVDDDGNPIPGATVNLYDDEGNPIGTGVSGEDGRVVFPNLPDGEYRAIATHPDHPGWTQEREAEILNGSDEVRIVVIPGPLQYPPDCECECECPDCECVECECVECECDCDCEPPQRRRNLRKPGGTGTAPRTGDLLSVTPLLSSILFSLSAIFGGTALRRRFKK